jgi:hypothetical protein
MFRAQIAARTRLVVLPLGIHLSDRAVAVAAGLISDWLSRSSRDLVGQSLTTTRLHAERKE